jgi:hypothetical protein
MVRYWWVVTLYNVAVLGYVIAVYYIGCPHYYSFEARKLDLDNHRDHR